LANVKKIFSSETAWLNGAKLGRKHLCKILYKTSPPPFSFKGVRVMVFNTTFNNISAIWWRSVLFVEETEVPGKNHQPAASH
jgi:hypothetical protein